MAFFCLVTAKMKHIFTTPFGRRAVDRNLLVAQARAESSDLPSGVDKWQVFDDLRTARDHFGLSDRDLTVLNALISFLPDRTVTNAADLIVFPSNATLSERAHGMAESTLRRHLAALVNAGVISRHDSPNGKRYARRSLGGDVIRAFGFSLRPLYTQADAISETAAAIREAHHRTALLREAITLNLRDAAKLLAYLEASEEDAQSSSLSANITDLRRINRRKMPEAELRGLHQSAEKLLSEIHRHLENVSIPAKMSGTDSENERHYQNSKPESQESEKCDEVMRQNPDANSLHLDALLKACPDMTLYAIDEIQSWPDLVSAASKIHPMMGIDEQTWHEAQRTMGPVQAAATLAAILQKMSAIRNPGGYLRRLSEKAAENAFSPIPMVMALLGRGHAKPCWS